MAGGWVGGARHRALGEAVSAQGQGESPAAPRPSPAHLAAQDVAGLEDNGLVPSVHQVLCGGQPRQPRASHHHRERVLGAGRVLDGGGDGLHLLEGLGALKVGLGKVPGLDAQRLGAAAGWPAGAGAGAQRGAAHCGLEGRTAAPAAVQLRRAAQLHGHVWHGLQASCGPSAGSFWYAPQSTQAGYVESAVRIPLRFLWRPGQDRGQHARARAHWPKGLASPSLRPPPRLLCAP